MTPFRATAATIVTGFHTAIGARDCGMRVVPDDLHRLGREVVDGAAGGIESQLGKLARLAGQLLAGLVEMVAVEVRVAERVDEVPDLEVAHLRDHVREERVRRDVERHAEEEVARALIELAREPAIRDVANWKSA